MRTDELRGHSFACIEECGFCCTFTPEVEEAELQRLRRGFPALPVVRADDRVHLAFQGGCGACTLLKARRCTAYEERPAHCRYFPFHVYFGEEAEAVVNYTCRGVARDPASDLRPTFERDVLGVAPRAKLLESERQGRRVHAEFERNAREAGAWGDVRAGAERALAGGPRLFDGPADRDDVWDGALLPFEEKEVVARPFHLTKDLRWLTFRLDGDLEVLELDETGRLDATTTLQLPATWTRPPPTALPGLVAELGRLARRGVFAGSVFEHVHDVDYEATVEEAARSRLEEMAADLAVRSAILERLGIPPTSLADEAARFYDSAFLDTPTVGGWL